MINRRAQGATLEDRVAEYLRDAGFTLVTRRWKSRRGEIDVIALDGETLVFVEVKARSQTGSMPELAVTDRKMRTLDEAGARYRAEMEWGDRPWRWDVVAVTPTEIRHHRDVGRD